MSQDTFSLFLEDANKQSVPQMLLFVFARALLPADATDEQRYFFQKGQGSRLQPVSCVNKSPADLSDFNSLIELSGYAERPWDVVFIASIIGPDGQTPVDDEIHNWLKSMVDSVVAGNVKQFLALNQKGERLSFD